MSSKKVHAQLIFMNDPHTHSDHSYTLNIEPHKEDTSYSINVGTEVSWTLLCMHVRLQSHATNDLQVVCSIGQAVCKRADSGHGVVQVRIDDKQLRGLYCCTCKYNKQHCSHVDIVEKALNSPDEDKHDCLNKIAKDLSSVQQNRQVHVHQYRSLSSSSIPFNLSSESSQQLACTVADRFNIVNNTSILGSVDT